jgi:hypothetical protein
MKNIGTNESSSTPGAWTPTATTIAPITAASEYAGAVESRPIASPSTKPMASFSRPLSPAPAPPGGDPAASRPEVPGDTGFAAPMRSRSLSTPCNALDASRT